MQAVEENIGRKVLDELVSTRDLDKAKQLVSQFGELGKDYTGFIDACKTLEEYIKRYSVERPETVPFLCVAGKYLTETNLSKNKIKNGRTIRQKLLHGEIDDLSMIYCWCAAELFGSNWIKRLYRDIVNKRTAEESAILICEIFKHSNVGIPKAVLERIEDYVY
ncbi:hypothetical protein DRZ77_01410 [Candidatus Woesearchaeota archaeon]|nr:hypothetical protein [Candidatus Woesearchaeota archaeon]RLE40757.1 MAG: hypothetical protein DRZ77_01410 [Candidatus Woesearchaeota archaeon]